MKSFLKVKLDIKVIKSFNKYYLNIRIKEEILFNRG